MRQQFNAIFRSDGSVVVSPGGIALQFDTVEEFNRWIKDNNVKVLGNDWFEKEKDEGE